MTAFAIHLDTVTASAGQHISDSHALIEQFTTLVDQSAIETRTLPHLAFVRRQCPRQKIDQSGLTRTIRTDDPDPIPPQNPDRQIPHDHAVAKGLADLIGNNHLLARSIRHGGLHLHTAHRLAARFLAIAQGL